MNTRLHLATKLTIPLLFVAVGSLLMGCTREIEPRSTTGNSPVPELPPEGEDFFLDITEYSGIDFRHTIGDEELSNIIESDGGGAAFLDYNQDGAIDLYVVNGAYSEEFSTGDAPSEIPRNALYKNMGNGQFIDVTDEAGVGDTNFGIGVTAGDYNNDGYPDIYVTNYRRNTLYRNNGDGTFSNVTDRAAVGGDEFSVGAIWLDYDRDGLLDLYVGNYVEYDPEYNLYYMPDGFPGPLNFDGQADRLYHNLGEGRFDDVTRAMGLVRKNGRAMGVASSDYDNDGYPDIYVANDQMANYMFRNIRGQKFEEVAIQAGTAFNHTGEATSSMAVDFGDYDGNGLLDLFVSDESYNALYTNLGDGRFTDFSSQSGIAALSGQHTGWASSFIDYDNNMFLDIFTVNGEIQHLHGQEDQLFENQADGRFEDVSVNLGSYFREAYVGRGACFGDIDNDGDIDAFIVVLDDRPILLRNDKGNEGNWLMVNLVGTISNQDGVGAKVTVIAGGKEQISEKTSGSGYLSQNDPRLHFGLGSNETVQQISVAWPSGVVQTIENIDSNQILTIEEGEHIQ
ncbi:MAG: CRTAC1 family protein [Balneolaceae bacterium]|nr:CRTAC1 family protein [Balneolaceae bacterium]